MASSISRAKSLQVNNTHGSTPTMAIQIPRPNSKHSGTNNNNTSMLNRQLRTMAPPRETNLHDLTAVEETTMRTSVENEEIHDKVVKNGWLHKRNKAKQWQRRWFVLRDHQLVYYKDENEYKVEGLIQTVDIMTVVMVTDSHKPNHFVIFTSSSNLHLRADNTPDAQDWCDVVRQVAEDSVMESSLSSSFQRMNTTGHRKRPITTPHPEPEGIAFPSNFDTTSSNTHKMLLGSPGTIDFSGPEDQGMSSGTSEPPNQEEVEEGQPTLEGTKEGNDSNEEVIIRKGHLLRLKKRYNQWKRQYVILTNQRCVFYKNERSKEPIKVVKIADLIDVVETDPLSKSKRYCMIVITAEKRLRLCAESEEDLTKWLASFKSQSQKRA